jgi:hypothetical protein
MFEVETNATFTGVYHARVMAKGVTLRGTVFTREQLASAAVWKGGDNPVPVPPNGFEGSLGSIGGQFNDKCCSRLEWWLRVLVILAVVVIIMIFVLLWKLP